MSSQDPPARSLNGADASDARAPLDRPNLVYHEAQERMALLPNYYSWIHSHFAEHLRGTVLELGCGAGFVMKHYVDRVERVIGVDINPELLAALERSYAPGKVRTACVDLRTDWREIGDVKADVIVALDVVEHFEDDAAFVDKLARHLNPRGTVVIKVPAQSRLYDEMDKASGHFRRYDARDLEQLMQSRGFETLSLRHMNPAGAWSYRLKKQAKTNFSRTFSSRKLKFVNRLMPVLSLLDRVPGLKGLSLIGVFRARR
jgi:SAM-dependent methyltransferase